MDVDKFWYVIGLYNQGTVLIQAGLIFVFTLAVLWACLKNRYRVALGMLGVLNCYIGVVFFLVFGIEPIQTFFSAPLFVSVGLLFWYESFRKRDNFLKPFNRKQWGLFLLVLLYPVISLALGNSFPSMTLYIMPCPVASISIVIYSSVHRKNKLLLSFLALWGLTGIKSFFFNALEDVILLICGIYAVCILVQEFRNSPKRIIKQGN